MSYCYLVFMIKKFMNPNLHEDVASMQIKLPKLQLNFINFSKHYSNILDISWIFNFQLVNNQINKINFPSKRTIAVLCVKKTTTSIKMPIEHILLFGYFYRCYFFSNTEPVVSGMNVFLLSSIMRIQQSSKWENSIRVYLHLCFFLCLKLALTLYIPSFYFFF